MKTYCYFPRPQCFKQVSGEGLNQVGVGTSWACQYSISKIFSTYMCITSKQTANQPTTKQIVIFTNEREREANILTKT